MNTKNILCLLGGLGLGAVGGFLTAKSIYEKQIEDEVEKVRQYYILKTEDEENEKIDDDISEEFNNDELIEEDKTNYTEIIDNLNYNRYSTKPSSEVGLRKDPYLIEEQDYIEKRGHNKIVLSYFEEDSVLMNAENDEVIEDPNKSIGFDNLASLDGNNTTIYVRNEYLGNDYQIILESGTYEDYVGENEWND